MWPPERIRWYIHTQAICIQYINGRKLLDHHQKIKKLLKHQESKSHRVAVAQADMCSNIVEKKGSVFTQLHNAAEKERAENLKILSKYIKVVYWLMKNEVACSTH